jgi:hypothetical protein
MGFLSNLGMGVKLPTVAGLTRVPDAPANPGFLRTLTAGDFMDTATPTDVTATAGTYVPLGDGTDDGYAVPAQQAYQWGYGSVDSRNQGFIYVVLKDDTTTPADEDGMLRLQVADANQMGVQTVFEQRTEELDGDANDINKRLPLPATGRIAREDDLLIIRFKADTTDVIQPDQSTIRIPAPPSPPRRPPCR